MKQRYCRQEVSSTTDLSFVVSVQFIVVFVVKVLKVKELNDVREYEDDNGSRAAKELLGDSKADNNEEDAGHLHSAQGYVDV